MPENLRFDIYQRLDGAQLEPAAALMTEIVELQRRWTEDGSEEDFLAWRHALEQMHLLIGDQQESLARGEE